MEVDLSLWYFIGLLGAAVLIIGLVLAFFQPKTGSKNIKPIEDNSQELSRPKELTALRPDDSYSDGYNPTTQSWRN